MSEVRHHSTTDQARRIDKYVFSVEDVLGEGNFSKVYCGINEITN